VKPGDRVRNRLTGRLGEVVSVHRSFCPHLSFDQPTAFVWYPSAPEFSCASWQSDLDLLDANGSHPDVVCPDLAQTRIIPDKCRKSHSNTGLLAQFDLLDPPNGGAK
jgi:hypothetical protein